MAVEKARERTVDLLTLTSRQCDVEWSSQYIVAVLVCACVIVHLASIQALL